VKKLHECKLELQERVVGVRFSLMDWQVLASDSEKNINQKNGKLILL
jgi:hypothetical protein